MVLDGPQHMEVLLTNSVPDGQVNPFPSVIQFIVEKGGQKKKRMNIKRKFSFYKHMVK